MIFLLEYAIFIQKENVYIVYIVYTTLIYNLLTVSLYCVKVHDRKFP